MPPNTKHPKLIDLFQNVCRTRHLGLSTERTYWNWVRLFIKFHGVKTKPDLMVDPAGKFAAFITAEARRGVASSTQNQAWNAILFLYRDVLKHDLGELPDMERAIRPARLPDVPACHADAIKLVSAVPGAPGLALRLCYGAALRVSDVLRLRLKDLDFANDEILIRSGKGDKDRLVPMPGKLKLELQELALRQEAGHLLDKHDGGGWVWLPGLLGKKNPGLHFDTGWQYLFAAAKSSVDPVSGKIGRHHLTPECLQTALRQARKRLKVRGRVTPHSLRHAGAREMERRGTPISAIQRVMGHSNVATTMRYLGIKAGGLPKINGPLD